MLAALNSEHLVEIKIDSKEVYQGNFLKVLKDTVLLPNGKQGTREYIVHPGAVVVIAMLDDGRLVLERQHRYPVGQVMLEFPAGKLDSGENPQYCGQRELKEETGYTAKQWAYAGPMHLCIAYSTEVIHVYFAKNLTLGERKLDEGESLDVLFATPEQLLDWCAQGLITDAKTLTCMLWLQNVLSGAWQLHWVNATDEAKITTPLA